MVKFFKKLKAIAQDPGKAANVVAKSVSAVVTGRQVPRHTIPPETLAKPVTIGKAIAAPISLFAGAASGTIAGVGASVLPDKAGKVVADHPFASTAALGLAVVAPGAVIVGGTRLLSTTSNTVKRGAAGSPGTKPAVGGSTVPSATSPVESPPKRPKAKRRSGHKPKNRNRRRSTRKAPKRKRTKRKSGTRKRSRSNRRPRRSKRT